MMRELNLRGPGRRKPAEGREMSWNQRTAFTRLPGLPTLPVTQSSGRSGCLAMGPEHGRCQSPQYEMVKDPAFETKQNSYSASKA